MLEGMKSEGGNICRLSTAKGGSRKGRSLPWTPQKGRGSKIGREAVAPPPAQLGTRLAATGNGKKKMRGPLHLSKTWRSPYRVFPATGKGRKGFPIPMNATPGSSLYITALARVVASWRIFPSFAAKSIPPLRALVSSCTRGVLLSFLFPPFYLLHLPLVLLSGDREKIKHSRKKN